MSNLSPEAAKVFKKLWNANQLFNLLGAPSLVYLLIVIMGVTWEQAKPILYYVVPFNSVFLTGILPNLLLRKTVQYAFDAPLAPGESEGARLERLLKVPARIIAVVLLTAVPGVSIIVGSAVFLYGKNPWIIPWACVCVGLHVMLLMIPAQISYERLLSPYTLAEFHKKVGSTPKSSGILWMRQAWFLPYSFAIFVTCTLATALTVIGKQGYNIYQHLLSLSADMSARQFEQHIHEAILR